MFRRQLLNSTSLTLVAAASLLNVFKAHLMINMPVLLTINELPLLLMFAFDISGFMIIILGHSAYSRLRDITSEAMATGRSWREVLSAPLAALLTLFALSGAIEVAGDAFLYQEVPWAAMTLQQLGTALAEAGITFVAALTYGFAASVLILIMWAMRLRVVPQCVLFYAAAVITTAVIWLPMDLFITMPAGLFLSYVVAIAANVIMAAVLLRVLERMSARFAGR